MSGETVFWVCPTCGYKIPLITTKEQATINISNHVGICLLKKRIEQLERIVFKCQQETIQNSQ